MKRGTARTFWTILNPVIRRVAGYAPWWVLLETTGRRTGRTRRTPLANGPFAGGELVLIAVHGERSDFVRNIAADPRVRVQRRGRWRHGTARIDDVDATIVTRFSRYARLGLHTFGDSPKLVRIDLD